MKATEARNISDTTKNRANEARQTELLQKFLGCIEAINTAAHSAKTYCEVAVSLFDEEDFKWLFGQLGYNVYPRNTSRSSTTNLWLISWQ